MAVREQPLNVPSDAPLDTAGIREALSPRAVSSSAGLQVFAEIGSTNTWLLEQPPPPADHWSAAVTDYQTDGRGRYGKRWELPRGAGICCSVAWTFARTPDFTAPLTLALGVGALAALKSTGTSGVLLKWPNDLMTSGGKLGGILVEVGQSRAGQTTVVAGIGINRTLPAGFAASIGRENSLPPVDLQSLSQSSELPSRNTITTALLENFTETFRDYASLGFGPFRKTWQKADYLRGRRIAIVQRDSRLQGRACGIGENAELLLDPAQTIAEDPIAITSGSVVLLDETPGEIGRT